MLYQIIYLGKPDGPTCHTGAETCYYTSVYDTLEGSKVDNSNLLLHNFFFLGYVLNFVSLGAGFLFFEFSFPLLLHLVGMVYDYKFKTLLCLIWDLIKTHCEV